MPTYRQHIQEPIVRQYKTIKIEETSNNLEMQTLIETSVFDNDEVAEDGFWNLGQQKDFLLHRIHAYPAKFPPFLAQKLIKYFESQGKNINLVADTFCGCGTSGLEAVCLGKEFWGCDINPIATLIARTKSRKYILSRLNQLYKKVLGYALNELPTAPKSFHKNERFDYWFDSSTIDKLYGLLKAIEAVVPRGKYREFFYTGFSNILKPCSKWLTKSIKPQIDPEKVPTSPLEAFTRQSQLMIHAVKELQDTCNQKAKATILTRNLLDLDVNHGFADIVITSPPYVTSYEYADLHQLSTLWLGFSDDYRALRKGTIGSTYNAADTENIYSQVNHVGRKIYDSLSGVDKSKARSVLRYFYDIDLSVKKIRQIVKTGGSVAFVIGNTSYKNVKIDNAKFLAQCLIDTNFANVRACKRKISYKNLTPYRDSYGRFTSHSQGRKVYSHEYILAADKN